MTQAQADQARKLFLYDGRTYVAIADMVRCSIDDVTRYLEGDDSVVEKPKKIVARREERRKPARDSMTPRASEPPAGATYHALVPEQDTPRLARCAGGDFFDAIIDECIAERAKRPRPRW